MNNDIKIRELMNKMNLLEKKKKETTNPQKSQEIEESLINCRLAVSHYQFMKRPKTKKGITPISTLKENNKNSKKR